MLEQKRNCNKRCEFGAKPSVRTAEVKDSVTDTLKQEIKEAPKRERKFKNRRASMVTKCNEAHESAVSTAAAAKARANQDHVHLSDGHVDSQSSRVTVGSADRDNASQMSAQDRARNVRQGHKSTVFGGGSFNATDEPVVGSTPKRFVKTPGRSAAEKVSDAAGIEAGEASSAVAQAARARFNSDSVSISDNLRQPEFRPVSRDLAAPSMSNDADQVGARVQKQSKSSHIFDGNNTDSFAQRGAPVAGATPRKLIKTPRKASERVGDEVRMSAHFEATTAASRARAKQNTDHVQLVDGSNEGAKTSRRNVRDTSQDENVHQETTRGFETAQTKDKSSSIFSDAPVEKRPLRQVNHFDYSRAAPQDKRNASEKALDVKRNAATDAAEASRRFNSNRNHSSSIFAGNEAGSSPVKRVRQSRPAVQSHASVLASSDANMATARGRMAATFAGSGPLW